MKRLPPVLVIAFALGATATMMALIRPWSFEDRDVRWDLAANGMRFAGDVLVAAGAFELARRCVGRARRALRVAGWIGLGYVLAETLVHWLGKFERRESLGTLFTVWWVVALAALLAFAVAFALAAWPQRRLAIGGLAIATVGLAMAATAPKLLGWIHGDLTFYFRVMALGALVDTAGVLVLALGAAHGTADPPNEPARATRGFDRIAAALYLRVVALIAGTVITVAFVASSPRGGDSAESFLKLAVFSGAVIAMLSQAWLAYGVIDTAAAAVPELHAYALGLASAGALWSVGVMNSQLPEMYATMYGKYGSFGGETAEALVVALPLVATVSLAIVAAAIGAFATRRSLDDLRLHASGKGVAFVLLTLASVAITAWLIPENRSIGSFVGTSFSAVIAMLLAMLVMARLCKLAAAAIDREPGLPAAKVVS